MIFIIMARSNRLNVSILPILLMASFSAVSLYTSPVKQEPTAVYISGVENKIKIGKLTNNRDLAFGCKNIFEEVLQDKDYEIVSDPASADMVFSAEIMYFDVNRTKRNVSVFHSDVEETLVVMRGKLTDNTGKKIKEAVAEESSTEISTSTLITDEGSGKINQQALSSAIKKTCESLINKTFGKK